MDSHAHAPDLSRLVAALGGNGVRFVLVGGFAAVLHGSDRVTTDIDLAFAPDPDNLEHLVEALRPLRPILPRARAYREDHWDARALGGPWIRLRTDAGVVDLMRRLPGIDSFDGLWNRAVSVELFGTQVRVACVEDLIQMKENTGRARDRYDIDVLRALRDDSL